MAKITFRYELDWGNNLISFPFIDLWGIDRSTLSILSNLLGDTDNATFIIGQGFGLFEPQPGYPDWSGNLEQLITHTVDLEKSPMLLNKIYLAKNKKTKLNYIKGIIKSF